MSSADIRELLAPLWYISVITWFVPTVTLIIAQFRVAMTIGLAAVYCLLSAIYLVVALLIWVVAKYGYVALAGVAVVTLIQVIVVTINIQDKSAFDPSAEIGSMRWREWAWPGLARVDEWPGFARKMAPKGINLVEELPEGHKVRIFLRLHKEMGAIQASASEAEDD